MVTFSTKDYWGNLFVVFTVPLPNRPPVFMSMKVTEYNKDKSGVVIIDPEKFLELWRNEPHSIHRSEANGTPQTWPHDRKYGHAAEGFSHGFDNPVPLAYVSHGISTRTIVSHRFLWFGKSVRHEQFHYVGFTNGITRTIWLLTQGCTAFPVECEMPGARELHRVAAAPNTHFYTVGELAEVASHA
ncbi:hypothetical protein F6A13_02775 [Acidithiobacillus sp. 'AMD consortium']|uniref:Uncharacterized protein n=2 Tax=Acidithiobacillus ferridurans TaxID=1232575 RepID=A0A2Z6IN49_ACIFI|nr:MULTISPECIES: hypothetical protein [Acidithiobacillus]MBU2716525.1 hypothetical protein [Acidithiobacillus ferridurans]MBU2724584.1 hypothetical protein [Acidithiobacillus ferridurans]MBU2725928.1 hypothetical protein [Acidithiobacillus ferridurans]QFG77684.1 hypothetical protein F6A13_02775 [Acidithiobacillus sp. 'AMD consortium']BBF65513.1 hypothetical protein AFERRID_17310 [Acidithiobacillus ferridurans]